MSKKHGVVTEKEFKNVKLLQQADVSASKIAELTGRSWTTVSRMYKTDTFQDYCKLVSEANAVYKINRLAREAEVSEEIVSEPSTVYETGPEASEGEKSAIKLLENLIDEVKGLRQDFTELSDDLDAVMASKKVSFWRNS